MEGYEQPRIKDYGDLEELTASTRSGIVLDASARPGSTINDPVLTTTPAG